VHSLNGGETIQRLSRQFDITPTELRRPLRSHGVAFLSSAATSIDVSYAASPLGNTGGLYLFLP